MTDWGSTGAALVPLLPLGILAFMWAAVVIAGRRRRPVMVPAMLLPCGCLRFPAGLLLPCTEHDPAAEPPVGQWAAEMEDK